MAYVCELGVYTITLKPPMFLEADPEFLNYVATLPAAYDAQAYALFIKCKDLDARPWSFEPALRKTSIYGRST